MDNEFILAPALVSIQFALDPVENVLQSLRMINDTERLSGLHDWVTRTAAALSPERMHKHRLVFTTIEPHMCIPKGQTFAHFPAFVDFLERQKGGYLIEQINRKFDMMCRYYPHMLPEGYTSVNMRELLTDRARYLDFMIRLDDLPESDHALLNEAFDLMQDFTAVRRVVVEHLRFMWREHMQTEWERQLTLLHESISAFNRVDFSHKTALEAARIVTNRDLNSLLENKVIGAETVTFVPNPHLGPYVMISLEAHDLSIMYGARLPRGAQSPAQSEFSRAELLIRLNALADDARLQILELLTQREEMCAQDIIEQLGVSQSSASRHLSQLRATGYVIERRRDVGKCYSLNTDRVVDTLRALTNFLSRQ